ncbi:hypothetical protein HPB47_000626, partial [Ixodes persulcatus]
MLAVRLTIFLLFTQVNAVSSEPRDWCYLEEDSALCHVICDGDYQLCFAAKSGVFIDGINEPWAMNQATLEQERLQKLASGTLTSGRGTGDMLAVRLTIFLLFTQ